MFLLASVLAAFLGFDALNTHTLTEEGGKKKYSISNHQPWPVATLTRVAET